MVMVSLTYTNIMITIDPRRQTPPDEKALCPATYGRIVQDASTLQDSRLHLILEIQILWPHFHQRLNRKPPINCNRYKINKLKSS